jgi:hypothetical protein
MVGEGRPCGEGPLMDPKAAFEVFIKYLDCLSRLAGAAAAGSPNASAPMCGQLALQARRSSRPDVIVGLIKGQHLRPYRRMCHARARIGSGENLDGLSQPALDRAFVQ